MPRPSCADFAGGIYHALNRVYQHPLEIKTLLIGRFKTKPAHRTLNRFIR